MFLAYLLAAVVCTPFVVKISGNNEFQEPTNIVELLWARLLYNAIRERFSLQQS
jgi:hypothetical protein